MRRNVVQACEAGEHLTTTFALYRLQEKAARNAQRSRVTIASDVMNVPRQHL